MRQLPANPVSFLGHHHMLPGPRSCQGRCYTTCPAAEWVTIGRSALARGFLVGLDRALRDLRARIA